ncbi:MAG: hypothetical protein IJW55_07375 [Clostridia bacterium]|nr:hypothetical protein [Clostridia bacterium]
MKIIKYFIGGTPRYLIGGVSYTKEQLDELRDRLAGRRDRRYGIYNEWFKKNRKDGGKAYNQGCKDVEKEPHIAKLVVTVNVW